VVRVIPADLLAAQVQLLVSQAHPLEGLAERIKLGKGLN
jgi:hypothetical protein